MDKLIEVEGLGFSYGAATVLDNIGFSVSGGEFIALIGANGTGKSTLLRLLLGELSPQQGRIRLFEDEVGSFKSWWRLGYLPQDSVALAAGFPANVLEVVTMSLYREIGPFRLPGKQAGQKAMKALEQVGMADYATRLIGALSGGQIQRVMLARALAAGSELLLLDEPSNGMDADAVGQLYELLAKLSKQGIATLMVTHDLVRAGHYVDRTLCLDRDSVMHIYHPGHDICCIHHENGEDA